MVCVDILNYTLFPHCRKMVAVHLLRDTSRVWVPPVCSAAVAAAVVEYAYSKQEEL